MKFGIFFANTMSFTGGEGAISLGQAAEAAGFESLWTVEHVVIPEEIESRYPYSRDGRMGGDGSGDIPDPLIWLTYVAAATSTINLATGIVILPQRNPAVIAKEVATLDVMSGGRVLFGVGVGWLEEEFDALGVPFAGRGARTDEYIDAVRTLWSGDEVSFAGDFTSFPSVSSNPKPANGTVPIHIGGHSRKAAERAGRIGDGFLPGGGNIAELVDIVRQSAADAGRDPAAVEVTAPNGRLFKDDPQGAIEELESWGVQRAMVPSFLLVKGPIEEQCLEMGERLGIVPN